MSLGELLGPRDYQEIHEPFRFPGILLEAKHRVEGLMPG